MVKQAYKYNFGHFMGQCKLNYMMLCRLLPEIENEDEFEYTVKQRYRMYLQVTERHRYTTFVHLIINSPKQLDWLPATGINVRLYHDAELAEVVDNHGVAMQPVNQYPNPDMQQKDEKQGLNKFLGDWLSYCLKYGRSTEIATTDAVGGFVNRLAGEGE